MDENTQEIVKALGQLGNHISNTSPNRVLNKILEELEKINEYLEDIKSK